MFDSTVQVAMFSIHGSIQFSAFYILFRAELTEAKHRSNISCQDSYSTFTAERESAIRRPADTDGEIQLVYSDNDLINSSSMI